MADAVMVSLAIPTLDIVGWESDAAVSGTIAFSLPAPVILVGETERVEFTLLPTLEITGLVGNVTSVLQGTYTLPTPTLTITGDPGIAGEVVFSLPVFALAITDPDTVEWAFPAPTLALAGVTGVTGTVALQLPRVELDVTTSVQFVGEAALALTPTVSITGAVGATGNMAATLRRIALAADGYTGAVGTVALELPVVELDVQGYEVVVGTVALEVPALILEAVGRTAGSGASRAYVLNIGAQALTTYTGYEFNSMALFNGVYLGASDDGIFALTGDDDNGTAIDAVARVGISDFGTSQLKRVLRAYVGYSTDGEMELRVITDEDTTRRYRLASTSKTTLRGGSVKIGMGVEARYWQFELANVSGADFTLNSLEITPSRMGRRRGGNAT